MFFRKNFIVILVLFLISLRSFAFNELISDDLYEETKKIALEIAETCPAKDCIILSVGRSPVPINLFLENIKNISLKKIPLSNFRHLLNLKDNSTFNEKFIPLSKWKRNKLFIHFDNILGSLDLYSEKNIKIIDFSKNGYSLMAVSSHLEKYFHEKSINTSLEPLAISKESSEYYEKVVSMYGLDYKKFTTLRISPSGDLYRLMSSSAFEHYSSVPKWDLNMNKIGDVSEVLVENFEKAFQEKMKVDLEIQAKLSLRKKVSIVKLQKNSLFFQCYRYLTRTRSF